MSRKILACQHQGQAEKFSQMQNFLIRYRLSGMAKGQRPPLHNEIFRLVPALYPAGIAVLKRCGLHGPEFFTLSYIRHFGKELAGEYLILTSELSDVLTALFYESEGGSSGFITKLANKNLVRRTGINESERLQLFGSEHGSKAVIVLRLEGQRKLQEVNEEVIKEFAALFPARHQRLLRVLTFFAGAVDPGRVAPQRKKTNE